MMFLDFEAAMHTVHPLKIKSHASGEIIVGP